MSNIESSANTREAGAHVERQALWTSLGGAASLALLGLGVAMIAESESILLEGLFNTVYSIVALFTLYVAGLLRKPASDDFPFGYDAFIPLTNLIKSLLIAGVSIGALLGAFQAFANGGVKVSYTVAIFYGAIATTIGVGVKLRLSCLAKRAGSSLVAGDTSTWTMNAALSGGVLISFCAAFGLEVAGYSGVAQFIDPALVVILVAVTIGVPYSLGKSALAQLLAQAPAYREREPIKKWINKMLMDDGYRQFRIAINRTGDQWFVFVDIKIEDNKDTVDILDSDKLTDKIEREVSKLHPNIKVSLYFTKREV